MDFNEIRENIKKNRDGQLEKTSEEAWLQWLNLKNREPRDLAEIMQSNMRIEFKLRALIILLSPNLKKLQIPWNDKTSLENYLNLSFVKIENIPAELYEYGAEIICQNFYDMDSSVSAVEHYNWLIIQFLSVLPDNSEIAEELFKRFHINEINSYWNMDFASGYGPFCSLLRNENIPNKWKIAADAQMRERIAEEMSGEKHPRDKWEFALRCYTDHIESLVCGKKMHYPAEIFIFQMHFLVSPILEKYNAKLFNTWNIKKLLKLLAGPELRDLRHKFSRKVVLHTTKEHDKFSVYDEASKDAAEIMLANFPEDTELVNHLNSLITDGNQRTKNQMETKTQKDNKEEQILSSMQ